MSAKAPAADSFFMPVRFAVMREDLPAEVFMSFASDADVQSVKRWRVSPRLRANMSMRARAADACEFAKLAAKRWRHYRDTRTFAASLEALHHLISADQHGEYCFHLKITADWFPGILGCRDGSPHLVPPFHD